MTLVITSLSFEALIYNELNYIFMKGGISDGEI